MVPIKVSPEEGELFAKIKIMLEGDSRDDSVHIQPFPHLTKKAVEDLRYRAEVMLAIYSIIVNEKSIFQVLGDWLGWGRY